MMLMTLLLTVLLGTAIYAAVKFFGALYPIYGTLAQITFYGVSALYLWHLLIKGRR